MDRSYYTSFEIHCEDKSTIQPLLNHLKIKNSFLNDTPNYRMVDLFNKDLTTKDLIAPIELLYLGKSIILTVHPSAAEEVAQLLQALNIQ